MTTVTTLTYLKKDMYRNDNYNNKLQALKSQMVILVIN